ncbi:peptidase C26 family protein, partial [Vibrio parahaemolyticus V-223/04]
PPFLK